MKPREQSRGQDDLFRSRLDQIIDMRHELVRLGGLIDWQTIGSRLGEMHEDGSGQPPLPTRLMAGLAILKHMHNLSDEELTRRWVENPYYQHFCGEEHFRHKAPFDRSSMTRWRQRMGEERLEVLLQESLSVAIKTKAADVKDLQKIIVDTTVQEKAITFPTDAKLLNRARVMLVKLAKTHGVNLRQGYPRVGKLALMKYQRYAHAKQWNRAGRELRSLRTWLGRVIRDIDRQVRSSPSLNTIFRPKLFLAQRVRDQKRGEHGQKVYSIHAPEVECIGKGKAHKPYEFGVKVSVATTVQPSAGGQFVLADNKLALNADWDKDLLAIEHQALVDVAYDVEVAGFSIGEVDAVPYRGLTTAVLRINRLPFSSTIKFYPVWDVALLLQSSHKAFERATGPGPSCRLR